MLYYYGKISADSQTPFPAFFGISTDHFVFQRIHGMPSCKILLYFPRNTLKKQATNAVLFFPVRYLISLFQCFIHDIRIHGVDGNALYSVHHATLRFVAFFTHGDAFTVGSN